MRQKWLVAATFVMLGAGVAFAMGILSLPDTQVTVLAVHYDPVTRDLV